MVGLYGLLSYMVELRRAEIGLRIVLGATPTAVLRMISRESGLLLFIGLAAGVMGAVFASKLAASLLFG